MTWKERPVGTCMGRPDRKSALTYLLALSLTVSYVFSFHALVSFLFLMMMGHGLRIWL
jgi:hypothetical protein